MMNKFWKKIAVLALAGTMTLGMSVNALATETRSNLNTSTNNISDTSTINLIKDYIVGSNSQISSSITTPNGKIPTQSPGEEFIFTITRYGLWNVGQDGLGRDKYSKDNMPLFNNGASEGSAKNIFTITANPGEAESDNKSFVSLTVPTYAAVGDYWYQVVETDNNVAGVIYGTNDSQAEDITKINGNHNATYYIHVQVTNGNTTNPYIRTVTLHKTAPDPAATNADYENWYKDNHANVAGQPQKKVDDIQNKYYAGQLNITKNVTGTAGDKNELFEVTVEFKNESGGSMNSDITYKNFYNADGILTSDATSLGWTDKVDENSQHTEKTFTKKFYVKDGTSVTFDNIPYGVKYTITEKQPDDDKYTHSFAYTSEDAAGSFNGAATAADQVASEDSLKTGAEKWNAANATGSISDDSDTVTITNTKESTIDVGVITSNAPYVAMLILVAAALLIFVHHRKNTIEE